MKLALVAAAALAVTIDPAHATANRTENAESRKLFDFDLGLRNYHFCGADIVGKDIINFRAVDPYVCFKTCLAQPGTSLEEKCTGSTWTGFQGGWCWGKATKFENPGMTPDAAATSIAPLRSDTPVFWSNTYESLDMAGNDIGNSRKPNLEACKGECEANPNCFGVTWTNYNDGTCWFKNRGSKMVAKAGARSLYLGRAWKEGAKCP